VDSDPGGHRMRIHCGSGSKLLVKGCLCGALRQTAVKYGEGFKSLILNVCSRKHTVYCV
jgi:hypothetical protein